MALVAKPQTLLLLALLVFIMAMAFQAVLGPALVQVGVGISHANLKHGGEANIARQCSDGRGGYLFHNPNTDRFGMVCQLDEGFGVVITDAAGREVTAFLKNKMSRFEQVLQYMKNQGYELVH